jgi:dienelactone hydrolase
MSDLGSRSPGGDFRPSREFPEGTLPVRTEAPGRRQKGRLLLEPAALLLGIAIAGASDAAIVERSVAPKTTDPEVSQATADHLVLVNTSLPPEQDLFVFMPGTSGKPADTRLILQEAAAQGFRAIGLMYWNLNGPFYLCTETNTDVDCWSKIRREILTGEDTSTLVEVSRPNSIESRLLKLLTWLNSTYPDEGWGRWIVSGQPDWRRIRFSGWSLGGGMAAYIAKDREVAGVASFCNPGDYDLRLGKPAAWIPEPHVTPMSRYFAFIHELDDTVLWSRAQVVWSALGLAEFGPPAQVDGAQPPFGGSHQFLTRLAPTGPVYYHGMPVADDYTPLLPDGTPTYAPVWRVAAFWKTAATARKLEVTKAGSGTGTVSSSPAGIACGSTCSATFDDGQAVTLTATAGSGAVFAGWSGACSGTGSCPLSMTADRIVTATFNTLAPAQEMLLAGDRVAVSLTWRNPGSGAGGAGTPVRQMDQYGYFWFDSADNPEVFVKVLDFGGASFLVFHAALSDLEYTVSYRVVRTGTVYSFKRPAGSVCGLADGSTVAK